MKTIHFGLTDELLLIAVQGLCKSLGSLWRDVTVTLAVIKASQWTTCESVRFHYQTADCGA
ncbi:hypothetical protein NRB16_18625 [Pseudomonas sp. LJDD11]|uniref:hypothetical protein n=1 Tax=unclassified Pseudomonas TaxID=196821 RepID=UPI000B01A9DE|nr:MULTISPECIES: hypothetical protein [unclassified Pseudomonas]MCQ9425535.1 hypothetical protein [Pseudomonas sp. LJDD11]